MYNTINSVIAAYLAAKEAEKAAKKEVEKLATMIFDHANNESFFSTDDYNVIIDTRKRTGIDTETLYKDFPDFKDVYGKTTEYRVITAKAKQQAKTA